MKIKKRVFNYTLFGILTLPLFLFYSNCSENSQGREEATLSSDSNDVGASFSGQITSSFQYVSTSGTAWGYAFDPKNPNKTIRVIFYIDGPVGVGQYAGETQANVASVGPNSGHFFSFTVPPAFANGTQHNLYAYGYNPVAANLLKPNSISFISYTPKAEAVFNQQILGFVRTSCTQCHSWDYKGLYSGPLLSPTPAGGGTATTNRFIQKMTGQLSHSGGVFCSGGVNSGICAEIQRWWNAEFK